LLALGEMSVDDRRFIGLERVDRAERGELEHRLIVAADHDGTFSRNVSHKRFRPIRMRLFTVPSGAPDRSATSR